MSKHFGDFKDAVRFLKKRLPPKHKVSVRRVKLKGDAAADIGLDVKKRKFLIRISKSLPNDAAVLILLHEWAHALSWESKNHNIEWATTYSDVYNTYIEEDGQE